jgi:hypothetical protein
MGSKIYKNKKMKMMGSKISKKKKDENEWVLKSIKKK